MHYDLKFIPVVIFCLAGMLSCGTQQYTPFGTVQVTETFYFGKTEISNYKWRDYVNWHKSKYGDTSEAYINTLPDTTVWESILAHHEPYTHYFFRHPAYNNYPVVGISWEQAVQYCAWKTERAKEILASDIRRNFRLPASVHYRLPNAEEWEEMANADYSTGSQRQIRRNQYEKPDLHRLRRDQHLANAQQHFAESQVTTPVNSYIPNKYGVYNLLGNVAEMIQEKGIAKGGGWVHYYKDITVESRISYEAPTAWLGFRCVCDVEWEE